ncbi:MAG: hypothetical protein LBT76_02335, partial [Tannerella sp.]|nr:hypothetical protein [Tannerella sp.]
MNKTNGFSRMKEVVKLGVVVGMLLTATSVMHAKKGIPETPLRISTQQRVPSTLDKGAWDITNKIESWNPNQTAIIICDMW